MVQIKHLPEPQRFTWKLDHRPNVATELTTRRKIFSKNLTSDYLRCAAPERRRDLPGAI